jgi:hypothetical protein
MADPCAARKGISNVHFCDTEKNFITVKPSKSFLQDSDKSEFLLKINPALAKK